MRKKVSIVTKKTYSNKKVYIIFISTLALAIKALAAKDSEQHLEVPLHVYEQGIYTVDET